MRRRIVSVILILELLLILPVAFSNTDPYTFLQLAPGIRLVLKADPLGRLFAVLIGLIWFAVAFFAYEYMNHEGHRERFFGFYLMTLGALMGVCFAGNLVTLYMFYELMTLCSVPLVLHIGTRKAFDAAWRYWPFRWPVRAWACWGCLCFRITAPQTCLHPAACWIWRWRGKTGSCCWWFFW